MTYEQMERACIMHYDAGVPWEQAVREAMQQETYR